MGKHVDTSSQNGLNAHIYMSVAYKYWFSDNTQPNATTRFQALLILYFDYWILFSFIAPREGSNWKTQVKHNEINCGVSPHFIKLLCSSYGIILIILLNGDVKNFI